MRKEIIDKSKAIPYPSLLDDYIYDGRFLSIIKSYNDPIYKYINLPVREVVGLYKPGDYIDKETWRRAATGLRCDDWDEYHNDIRKYFEEDVGNIGFPTPSSSGELKLSFVGGAGYCGIGNNRVVAAKIHLVKKFGELAYLKNAWCNYKPIHPILAKVLLSAVENQAQIYFTDTNPQLAYGPPNAFGFKGVIKINHLCGHLEFYQVFTNAVHKIMKKNSLLNIVFNRSDFKRCQRMEYTPVSYKLVEKVFDLSKVSKWFSV